jgi:hypothetical protein
VREVEHAWTDREQIDWSAVFLHEQRRGVVSGEGLSRGILVDNDHHAAARRPFDSKAYGACAASCSVNRRERLGRTRLRVVRSNKGPQHIPRHSRMSGVENRSPEATPAP